MTPDLTAAGWAVAAGIGGAPAWTPRFEQVVAELQQALNQQALNQQTPCDSGSCGPMWYPPVMSRGDAERAGYAESFLDLLGSVHALSDGQDFSPTDAVLVPAMCYHIYPQLAGRAVSRLATFDLSGYCYRHERTHEHGRLRAYRVRELLAVGTADAALAWRDERLERASAFFRGLGLSVRTEVAADPFFGPGGRLLRATQLEQQLKFEFVCQIAATGDGTAIASANYHKDHFGIAFEIKALGGGVAHSACMGFGLERIVLALIHAHGHDRRNWPDITAPAASLRGH